MMQEKINIWGNILELRFSAWVPIRYYNTFEKNFFEELEKTIYKVGYIQEKIKSFNSNKFEDIKEIKNEINKVYKDLLEIIYILNWAEMVKEDKYNLYKFKEFEEWLNQFNEPNLFDFNWFVELTIKLEENFSAKDLEEDQEEESEEKSKKKLKTALRG
jgi:F0F1-type ATP synthase beta subunit